jgi:hypothetical protein
MNAKILTLVAPWLWERFSHRVRLLMSRGCTCRHLLPLSKCLHRRLLSMHPRLRPLSSHHDRQWLFTRHPRPSFMRHGHQYTFRTQCPNCVGRLHHRCTSRGGGNRNRGTRCGSLPSSQPRIGSGRNASGELVSPLGADRAASPTRLLAPARYPHRGPQRTAQPVTPAVNWRN